MNNLQVKLFIFIFLLTGKITGQCVSDFIFNSNSSADGSTQFKALTVDKSNKIIIAGQFNATQFSFPGINYNLQSYNDMVVIKSDAAGNVLWSKSFSSPASTGQVYPTTLITDSVNDIYVLGYYIGIATFGSYTLPGQGSFVLKMSHVDGSVLWAKKIGNYPQAIVTDFEINNVTQQIFLVGTFQNNLSLGSATLSSNGGSDLFIAEMNTSGTILNAGAYGGVTTNEAGICVKILPGGDPIIGVSFSGSGFAIGNSTLNAVGAKDICYTRIKSTDLTPKWVLAFGSPLDDFPADITVDGNSNVYCLSSFSQSLTINSQTLTAVGDKDVLIMKLDSSGNTNWCRSFGGPGRDDGESLVLGNGKLISLATVADSIKINSTTSINNSFVNIRNTLITAFDFNGAYNSHVITNDTTASQAYLYSHEARSIAIDGSQNIFIAGMFLNRVSIGGNSTNLITQNNSYSNAYFIKFCAGNFVGLTKNDIKPGKVYAYPNPFSETFRISLNTESKISEIRVLDLIGNVLYRCNEPGTLPEISLNGFESGIYFVEIISGNSSKFIKVLKQ